MGGNVPQQSGLLGHERALPFAMPSAVKSSDAAHSGLSASGLLGQSTGGSRAEATAQGTPHAPAGLPSASDTDILLGDDPSEAALSADQVVSLIRRLGHKDPLPITVLRALRRFDSRDVAGLLKASHWHPSCCSCIAMATLLVSLAMCASAALPQFYSCIWYV